MAGTISQRRAASVSMLAQMAVMALRYLNGHRLRTTLTTLAVVLGVALIFAVNLILPDIAERGGSLQTHHGQGRR
jgi:hypothetical protein